MRKKVKTSWEFKHKGVECEIVFWFNELMQKPEHEIVYPHKGIWNSYILIREEDIAPDLFKQLVCPRTKRVYPSGDRWSYDYSKFPIDMESGITYYEIQKTAHCKPKKMIKVGNDYNHIWNEHYHYDEQVIKKDLEKSVDDLLEFLGVEEIKNDY